MALPCHSVATRKWLEQEKHWNPTVPPSHESPLDNLNLVSDEEMKLGSRLKDLGIHDLFLRPYFSLSLSTLAVYVQNSSNQKSRMIINGWGEDL